MSRHTNLERSLAFHHSPQARAYARFHEAEIGVEMLKMRRAEIARPIVQDYQDSDLTRAQMAVMKAIRASSGLTLGAVVTVTRLPHDTADKILTALIRLGRIICKDVKGMGVYVARKVKS